MTRLLWLYATALALFASYIKAQQAPLGDSSSSEDSSNVVIYHRLIPYASSDSDAQAGWKKRGVVQLHNGQATWTAAQDAFSALAEDGDVYQIGLAGRTSPLESSPTITSFVSVPECHLHSDSSTPLKDTITLNFENKDSTLPDHVAYYVENAETTHCQAGDRTSNFNTTIRLAYPAVIERPRLHQPVVIAYQPDGTIKEPEPERSFLQKYWMWAVPVILLLMTSGGGGDEERPAAARR